MSTLFAPAEVFSAFSCTSDGSEPDLAKGTHLRLFAGLGASFPLAPFAVFKVAAQTSEPHDQHLTDGRGAMLAGMDLSQSGAAEVTFTFGDTDTVRTVRLDVLTDNEGAIKSARLIDQNGRVVASRDIAPFQFSAPKLSRVQLTGGAGFFGFRTKAVNAAAFANRRDPPPADGILGLPVDGLHAWYCGVQTRQDGLARVSDGAPLRLTPMDQPDGPFDAVGPDDEVARVEALLRAAELGGGLTEILANLIDDATVAPWLQAQSQRMPTSPTTRDQVAEVPRLGYLQMAAIDPGVARYLGFATRIDDLPDPSGRGWDALVVAGLFAVDLKVCDPDGQLGLADVDPLEPVLTEMILRALEAEGANQAREDIKVLIRQMQDRGLVVRALLAATAPTAPTLAPSLPDPEITEHRWQTPENNQPSTRYRTSFAFQKAPLAAMAAVAARIGGAWQPRHDSIDVGAHIPPLRAAPRIMGHAQLAWSMARLAGKAITSAHHVGLLADQNIFSEEGAIAYRFRSSDLFGRFGPATEITVQPPPRPAPPVPVLRFEMVHEPLDPAATRALSPGHLSLTIVVTQPPRGAEFSDANTVSLASAMVVPLIADSEAGTLSILSAEVSLGADTRTIDLSGAGVVDLAIALPPLLPQQTLTLPLTARFFDSAGVASPMASQKVKLTDKRPPLVLPTGIGLFWTSAPGPSPDVEVQLVWPAAASSRFRVYVTDEQGLGLQPGDLAEAVPGAAPSRGRVAQIGGNKVLGGGEIARGGFRLMTQTPVVAGADARAIFKTTLPRSLQTVQFLRVVPLGSEGAEAPFDQCGIVPVAVPDSRRPAPPFLEGKVDSDTGTAHLTVIAKAFDRIALQRDEPGLFDAVEPDVMPPGFRIRRAVGAIADPIYGRAVAQGSLARDATADPDLLFSAMVSDDNAGRGLEPFVRYVYWAEVRLPPERRLPAGVGPVDPPGGISVLDPGNAASHARPASLPSAPRVLMRAPAGPPDLLEAAAITLSRSAPDGGGTVAITIDIADAPLAHAKAIGPYRLAVWAQWPDQPIAAVSIAEGVPTNVIWPEIQAGRVNIAVSPPALGLPPESAIVLRLAIVDPIGRIGEILLMPPI